MKTYFRHYRLFDPRGRLDTNGMLLEGGVTLFVRELDTYLMPKGYTLKDEQDAGAGRLVELEVGVAICSHVDNYNRRLGRAKAQGRADSVRLRQRKVVQRTFAEEHLLIMARTEFDRVALQHRWGFTLCGTKASPELFRTPRSNGEAA